jgi:competence protein ComEA
LAYFLSMDELLTRVRRIFNQVGPSKRLLLLLFILVIAIAAVIGSLGGSQGQTIATKSIAPSEASSVHSPTFYVHVVGRVKSPGVYELDVGSRLFDAVVAAGGFTADADQSSVNLARQLTDGEQIVILKLGDQASPSGTANQSAASSMISINRASEAELESLPGVGPALANRIIDWRTANGGFKRKEDLLQVGGIGSKLFAGLEKLITL